MKGETETERGKDRLIPTVKDGEFLSLGVRQSYIVISICVFLKKGFYTDF